MVARFVNNSGKDARNAFHINRCDSFNSDNLHCRLSELMRFCVRVLENLRRRVSRKSLEVRRRSSGPLRIESGWENPKQKENRRGETLITTYPDREAAKAVNAALRAEGIATSPAGTSNVLMTEWGLHLYYNNLSLVNHTSVDPSGFPWTLPGNEGTGARYEKGACPIADSLFERSILLPIPSCLTAKDEADIIAAFQKVLDSLL